MHHDQPDSPLIRLKFVRFRSAHPDPGPPIMFLMGGPGGSALSGASGGCYEAHFEQWLATADVICCDQRGTGGSQPSAPNYDEPWNLPFPEPLDWDQAEAAARIGCRRAADFYRAGGVDLNAFNTADSADDLDLLRAQLGEPQVRLWGISYGTHLALAMIRRHEASVAGAVLVGVEGPDATLKRPALAHDVLDEVAEQCAADPAMRRHVPDLHLLIEQAMQRVRRGEITMRMSRAGSTAPIEVIVTPFDVEMSAVSLLRTRSSMAQLPLMFYELAHNRIDASAEQLSRWRDGPWSFGRAMSQATDAASGVSPQRLAQIQAESDVPLFGRALNFPALAVMQALGVRDLGNSFRDPIRSDVPLLCISGTLDPRTPLAGAIELLRGFPNGQHLIIENAGHSDDDLVLSSALIREAIQAFWLGEGLPTTRVTLPPIQFQTP